MGIPKFFRFISERWPMISELIGSSQIPEFDNLYLDMNSILHNCTQPKDESVTRLTEEQVFSAIFAYIDHLFDIIKPQKVFYMALDGVAPRAKQNQQRSRRFRTAFDAEKKKLKAIESGEELPKEEPFDSNSITPGTEFMAKLTRYLKYFIHQKISTDSKWQNIEIILSGHEAPGEGEHKIMEFIRTKKSLPDYNPNTRHCIYGLDADLIMLGLVSHDPHFALLREEVTFGRKQSAPKALEDQKFYLLHLSLVREYMSLEFKDLEDQIQFDYNFERVLDDFILIMYVIGNDFLPNLPELHLNKGAFPLLIETFKEALRSLDGYINEFGTINLKRLGVWLDILSKFEIENFEQKDIDLEWFNKQLENLSLTGAKKREKIGKIALLKQQRRLASIIKPWLFEVYSKRLPTNFDDETKIPRLVLPTEYVEENLDFLKSFAIDTDLIISHSKADNSYSVRIDVDGIDLNESDEEFAERSSEIHRVVKKYEAAIILDSEGAEDVEERQQIYNQKFEASKDEYYKEKVSFSLYDEDKLKAMAENYVEGLQWVLYYYYRGCQSWSWYYKYHYAPKISDIKKGLDVIINFENDTPFKPFEQLMSVLPARSSNLVPVPYRHLMHDEHSPIIGNYPNEVEIDKNGKTAEWEAVVKLPFVNIQDLRDALKPLETQLNKEEVSRNSFGSDILFTFNPQIDEVYKSPLPGVFTDLEQNHCFEEVYKLPKISNDQIITGLVDGALTGRASLAGFPTLESIPFTHELKNAGVLIFNQPSRSTSVILTPRDTHDALSVEEFAKKYLNKFVYTGYPYLKESKIIKISDGRTEFTSSSKIGRPIGADDSKTYRSTLNNIRNYHKSTRGVELGEIRALVYVKTVSGVRRNKEGAFVKHYNDNEEIFPLQLVVEDVLNKDTRNTERPPLAINEEFPIGSKVIFLGEYAYGGQAIVTGYTTTSRLELSILKTSIRKEPVVGYKAAQMERQRIRYSPSYEVARNLRVHPLFLSKITSSFMILDEKNRKVNVGLDLKFDGRREKVIGFTKRAEKGWLYSGEAIKLIQDYRNRFNDFFNALGHRAVDRDIPSVKDIWPTADPKEVEQRLKTIVDWLRSVKSTLNRASLESDALSRVSIAHIEAEIQKYAAQIDQSESKNLAGVPREAVLDSSVSLNQLKSQTFELGDRVVYVHDSGKVPLFSKGTVVAYTSAGSAVTLRILFDKPLIGGNNLDGRLTTNRGLDVDSSLVLNISNRQFIYHSQASGKKKAITKVNAKIAAASDKPTTHTGSKPSLKASSSDARAAAITPKKTAPKPKPEPKSNELLSLLKGGKPTANDRTSEEATNDASTSTKDEPMQQDEADLKKAFTLRSIQASLLGQLDGSAQQQFPSQMPLHQKAYQVPGQPLPPFFPVTGLPGPFMPANGYPSQPIPQGVISPVAPVQQEQQQQHQSLRAANGADGKPRGSTRGRGRGRGRGGSSGRGRGRGRGGATSPSSS